MIALGAKAWEALRQPSPSALSELTRVSDAVPEFGTRGPSAPPGASVARRRIEPDRADGVAIVEGPLSAGEAFARFGDQDTATHLGLGDTLFFAMLRRLAASPSPPIVIACGSRESPHRDVVTLAPAGRRLLAGELDWLTTRPLERWVGGCA
jgi:hypothetical protein